MKAYCVDTNFVLRYLLYDIKKQADTAENYFRKAKEKAISVYIPLVVFVELVFALKKFYKFTKTEIVRKLGNLAEFQYLEVEKREVLIKSLFRYKDLNISFVDLLIYFEAVLSGKKLLTFDKKLKKLA